MPRSLRNFLVVVAVGVLVGFTATGDDSPPKEPAQPGIQASDDVLSHERLCVTIWPAKTQVKVEEEFEVKLRVVNSSEEPQSLKVYSCSWDMHWTWKNPRISSESWSCFRNSLGEVRLRPGEAYEKTLVMRLIGGTPAKPESLRMGFKPAGQPKTYWSNEVVLGVK